MAKKGTTKKKASVAKKTTKAATSADTPAKDDPQRLPAWSRLHLWQIQWVRDVLVGLLVLGLFWLGQKISIVTVPLLLALLFAYLFEPVIVWLMRKTPLKRPGAVSAIIAAVVVFVVIPASIGVIWGAAQGVGLLTSINQKSQAVWNSVLADRAYANAQDLYQEMLAHPADGPDAAGDDAPTQGEGDEPAQEGDDEPTPPKTYTSEEIADQRAKAEQLKNTADEKRALVPESWDAIHDELIRQRDRGTLDDAFGTIQGWVKANAENVAGTAASAGVTVVERTIKLAFGTFGFLFMLFLTAFFFFFMSTGWVQVKGFGEKLLPESNKGQIIHLMVEFNRVINAFIRGRLTIAFIQSIVFTIGYLIIGVPAAFIVGPIVAILSIVPYLALVGIPISITLLWLEGQTGFRAHWLWIIGAPTAFYFMVQALDDYVLTPWIQGKSTDMSTPMILFASLAGGVLFGVFGLLIAIPIAACLKILIQEIFWPRFKAWTEGEVDDFLPIKRE